MSSIYTDKSEYAISTWTLEDLELHEALREIAIRGFSTVELWADTVHFDPRLGVDRKAIGIWLQELKLSVHSVHSPFRNFPHYDDERQFRDIRQRLWRRTIDDCSDLAVPIMVVHGVDRNEYNYPPSQMQIVGDSLADLCEYGRKRGVMIALENISPGNAPSDEIRCWLRDHVRNYPGIGLKYCLDIGHVLLNGADLYEEVDAAGKDLITLHIHNNDGKDDLHSLPDAGVIDWPALRAYLRDGRYGGQFVMEVHGGDAPIETLSSIANLFDK